MDTISEQSGFSRQSREQDEGRYVSGNIILWIAVIAVLIGLNFASWSFCMWVFGQPEHPMNYRLLTRLEKLDPIKGFKPVSAPRGKFFSAKDLYAQVYPFSKTELRAYNGILKRYYLKNYLERSDVTFISGEFSVLSVQRLEKDDVFSSGLVIRARSTSFPDAILDLALPSDFPPESFELKAGQVIKVGESTTCAAVLNIDRLQDSTMVFTAVPLVGRDPADRDRPGNDGIQEFAAGAVIEVWPPKSIHIDPDLWPISEDLELIETKPVELSVEPIKGESREQGEVAPKAGGSAASPPTQ